MGYFGRYRFCKIMNFDAALGGYSGADVRAHCREYALTPRELPIHIPMVAPPSAPTGYQVNTGRRKSLEVRSDKPDGFLNGLPEKWMFYVLILGLAVVAYWKFK